MNLPVLTIYREKSTDDGTYGILHGNGIILHTLEQPWRDNINILSCVHEGHYTCQVTYSNRFKQNLYEIVDVPGRGTIRIHSGNLAGDISKGLCSDTEGGVLVGKERGPYNGQKGVLKSSSALSSFMESMGGREFRLVIKREKYPGKK